VIHGFETILYGRSLTVGSAIPDDLRKALYPIDRKAGCRPGPEAVRERPRPWPHPQSTGRRRP
jgi:hypothetical protein